jgi:hypothetical protein
MDDGKTALTGVLLVTDSPPAKAPGHVVIVVLQNSGKRENYPHGAPILVTREEEKLRSAVSCDQCSANVEPKKEGSCHPRNFNDGIS